VRADDVRQTKRDKIRLLRSVLTLDNFQVLLREFITYADDTDDEVVADAIHAIGYCARLIPDSTQQCLTALMSFIQSKYDVVVAHAVLVLKSLVQVRLQKEQSAFGSVAGSSTASTSPLSIIARLAWRIDEIRHPKARACVIWLTGQYAAADLDNNVAATTIEGIVEWAPDVLRKSAKTFIKENVIVKLQILTLAAKLLVLCPTNHTLGLIYRYVFSLARYDLNFDVRDRARMLSALLAGVISSVLHDDDENPYEDPGGVILRREQVKMVLLAGKLGVSEDIPKSDDDRLFFGSLGAISGKESIEDLLPDWLEEGTESSLRDSEDDAPPALAQISSQSSVQHSIASRATPIVLTPTDGPSPSSSFLRPNESRNNLNDLDRFYEDTSEQEEEDEETETEESEEDDSEEEEESEGDGSKESHEEESEGGRSLK